MTNYSNYFDEEEENLEILKKKEDSNNKEFNPDYRPYVTSKHIRKIISSWTGIPITKLTEDESKRLLNIEEELHEEIIGQDRAVKAIAKCLKRAATGIRDEKRPIGSFIFCGPTGVGKTQLAKVLAQKVFGSEKNMIRFDMSEFYDKHTVSKLIGAPPGYIGYEEGGLLTEAVRQKPYSIILFDEMEKAHADTTNMLLQVLDDGILTDGKGRTVKFNNTIIIMTSNLGSDLITQYCLRNAERENQGFIFNIDEIEKEYQELKKDLKDMFAYEFRPEFINRVDDFILFEPLTRTDVRAIGKLLLDKIGEQIREKNGYTLGVTTRLLDLLVREGFDPLYGARPLRRAISEHVESFLSTELLSKTYPKGTFLVLDYDLRKEKVFTTPQYGGVKIPFDDEAQKEKDGQEKIPDKPIVSLEVIDEFLNNDPIYGDLIKKNLKKIFSNNNLEEDNENKKNNNNNSSEVDPT